MRLAEVLRVHAAAADQLRRVFATAPVPWPSEGAGRYALETRPDVAWLDEHLADLAAALLPAGYEFRLSVQVQRWKAAFTHLHDAAGALRFAKASAEDDQPEPSVDYLPLRNAATGSPPWDDLKAILRNLAADPDARLALTLVISLDTEELARAVAKETGARGHVAAWVFPEKLAEVLDQEPIDRLVEHVDPDRRTVILVAGMAGSLIGDHLCVFGASPATGADPKQHHDQLEAELEKASPLTRPDAEGRSPAGRVHEFRTAQKSAWQPYTSPLTPEMLSVEGETDHQEVAAALLRIRSLLALGYVANGVAFEASARYPVTLSFEGEEGRRELPLDAAAFPEDIRLLQAAYDLYAFSYEAESGVPIEIARRLTARMADDPALLFTRLGAIVAASEDVHAGYLGDEVTKYFGTLQKAETYLLRATRETEAAAVELTRDAGERLFKALGIVAGAVIAAAFEPDIENVAGIVASLTIGFYVALTLRYYMHTLRESAANLELRHAENLDTFRRVLPKTVATLLRTERVDDAWARYEDERKLAVRLLAALLVGAAIGLMVFVVRAIA